MTSVTNTTSTSAADIFSSINASGASSTTSTSTTADAQNRFLTLLMTQIKNQDPLNPMDNSQVTTQLAELNTVDGINKLNTTLTQLLSDYSETQGLQAAAIIGKNVMVAGNQLPLANGQAVGGFSLGSKADTVTLTIKDSKGNVVQTENLGAKDAGSSYFSWDGKDGNGNALAAGNYTFSLAATAAGTKVTATPMQIGTVSAVIRNTSGFVLDLGAMGNVALADVQQIL